MQTSIATVSLAGGLAEKLEATAAAGFTGVEIFESDLLSFNGTPKDVARMMADLGLKIVTFQPFRDFEGMPEPQRSRTFARAERKFDLMGELGCDLLMICSNVAPDSLGGIDRAAADFHELGERAKTRGIRVGFEALAWGKHISDYRDSWEVVRRADHPAIGLTLDSFHIFSRKTDLKAIRSIPADKIALVQLADAPWLDMDVINWSRHFRCFPGQGEFPLTDFMDAVFATGYNGILSLEIFNDQFRAGSPRGVAVDGQRSLIYLMDQMRDRPGALAKEAPQIPPRGKCLGIEFIEFAADDRPAAELAKLFAGSRLRQGRRAQVEGGDALVARRDQPRAQQRQGGLRPLASAFARPFGLRDVPEGRRRHSHPRPRGKASRHAVPAGGRDRANWKSRRCAGSAAPALFRRPQERARPAVGHRLPPRRHSRRATAAPALSRSTTSRSRCSTRRCCRGCCSTTRCSM